MNYLIFWTFTLQTQHLILITYPLWYMSYSVHLPNEYLSNVHVLPLHISVYPYIMILEATCWILSIFYKSVCFPFIFFSKGPTTFTSRMAGFSLFVSNTTSKDDGHLCFHEIQNVVGTPSEDQRIQCPFHARYVIYYNERRPEVVYPSYYSEFAYSDLCEVEVYGKLIVTNKWIVNRKES